MVADRFRAFKITEKTDHVTAARALNETLRSAQRRLLNDFMPSQMHMDFQKLLENFSFPGGGKILSSGPAQSVYSQLRVVSGNQKPPHSFHPAHRDDFFSGKTRRPCGERSEFESRKR